MANHWLKIITNDDVEAALVVAENCLAYVSGWEREVIEGGMYDATHSEVKWLLDVLRTQKACMRFHPDKSPFTHPEIAKEFLKSEVLKDTSIYKKVKGHTEYPPGGGPKPPGGSKPPGGGPPGGGPSGGGGGGGLGGPPFPDLVVPGGGMGAKKALEYLEMWKLSGAAGGSGGLSILVSCVGGLFAKGTIVACLIGVTAKANAEEAPRTAQKLNRTSELQDYFRYLANWATEEARKTGNHGTAAAPEMPLKFADWVNRRPPQSGY